MRFQDRVAIVTGAAGGIGSSTVRRLCSEGASVVGFDLDEARGEALASELRAAGDAFTFVRCDVADAESVGRSVEQVIAQHGRIDVLCNIAGHAHGVFTDVVKTSEEDWDRVQRTNLKSIFLMSKAVVPHMLARGSGAIVQMGTIVAMVGFRDRAAYTAAKGGVLALTREMALDYAPHGIRVNAVAPGVVLTPAFARTIAATGEAYRDTLISRIPLGRLAQPHDIAAAFAFLASDDAAYITGIALPVDGGYIGQ